MMTLLHSFTWVSTSTTRSTCSYPYLSGLSSVTTIRDFAQSSSNFPSIFHIQSFLFMYSDLHHALQSPSHNPLLHSLAVPIFLLVCWTTNHYSHLSVQLPQLYLTPAADLPFFFLSRYIPKLFFLLPQGFSPVSVLSGSLSPPLRSIVEKNSSYGRADDTEDRGERTSQLQFWTWHNRSHPKLTIREISLSPRADHANGILIVRT